MTTEIVPGLRLRPYAGEPDLAEIARIQNAEAEADRVPGRTSAAEIEAEFAHPNEHFDPRRDVTLAELDGRPVAVAMRVWIDSTDGERTYRVNGAVEPAARRRGIGRALLAENERCMRELAAGHVTPKPKVFGSWSGDSQAGATALLSASGFAPIRWFFEMTRHRLDDLPDVALPAGLEVRPITRDLVPAVWLASIEAFRDHWGGFDHSDEALERWLASPSTDVGLWAVAFDGDEVAGGVINMINAAENEALGLRRGLLASVFTRRAWRRRGVAGALVARSLEVLRERGMTTAWLGVDADNPSGALGLYERLGFEATYRSTAWRRPMEAPWEADRGSHRPTSGAGR
jgi:ribosomal protein S18 acetylase RimI-like enzyme